jgi:hypothetical protein
VLVTGRSDGNYGEFDGIFDFATVKYVPQFPPLITLEPSSQATLPGSNVTFTIAATGASPLAYQWRFNNAPISGATNTSLTLSNVALTNQGNYSAAIANNYGSVASAVAALIVISGYNQIAAQLLSGGVDIQLSYAGNAGTAYTLDRTFDLSPPVVWEAQFTNIAAANGTIIFTNAPVASTNNFWRIRSVP